MPKMNKKTLMIIAAGVGAVLLVMYLRGRSGAKPTDTTGTVTDQQASDYAQLAGMLQQQSAIETGDMQRLQGLIDAAHQQNLGDIQAAVANIPAGPAGAAGAQGAAGIAGGGANVKTIKTHPGGAFYKWYVKATGHPPPATVGNTNALYTMWQAGVHPPGQKAKTGKKHKPPSSNHPGTNGGHTNGNHPAGTGGNAVAGRGHAPPAGQPGHGAGHPGTSRPGFYGGHPATNPHPPSGGAGLRTKNKKKGK